MFAAKTVLDIGRPVHVLMSVAKLEHALSTLSKIQLALNFNPPDSSYGPGRETIVDQSPSMMDSSLKGHKCHGFSR